MTEAPVLHLPSVHFPNGGRVWPNKSRDYKKFEAGFKSLSMRALLMAGADDIVITDKAPDSEYMAFLKTLGSGGSRAIVPSHKGGSCLAEDVLKSPEVMDFIRSFSGAVEAYMVTELEEQIAASAGKKLFAAPAGVVDILNDKVFFQRLLEDLDFPRVETITGNSDAIAAKLRHFSGDEGVIVRGARGVGGSRTHIASGSTERKSLADMIEKKGKGSLFLMSKYLDVALSPNLQFYISDECVTLFGETVQLMKNGVEHFGNLFDKVEDASIQNSIVEQGSAICQEAAAMGYRGVVGVDFIVTKRGDVFAVEMNARHNTSTHALWFINRFFTGDPLAMACDISAGFVRYKSSRDFSAAQWLKTLGKDAFDPQTGFGILPYDTGTDELAAVVAASDAQGRRRLIELLEYESELI